MSSKNSYDDFPGWAYYANANSLSHTHSYDWPHSLTIVSKDTRHLMLAIESYAYNRTRVGLEDKERVNVARYLVHLGFLGDLSQNSRTYLMQFSDEGTKGFARGLEMRSKVYQGAAASFEGQWAPPEAIGAHRRLVRCLRDLAAIDRRAATELTISGHLDGFVSGEAETQDALSKINDALNEIKTGISSMFINGDLDSVIIGVMKSVVPQ